MKKQITVVMICVLGFVMSGCLTTSQNVEEAVATTSRNIILEDQGSVYGIEQPAWIGGSTSKIKGLYEGQQPVVVTATGEDLDLLKKRSNTTGVASQVAPMISTAVVQNARDMSSSTGSTFDEEAYSNAVNQASQATFRGLVKEDEWWVLQQKYDGTVEYTYSVLYLMDSRLFNEQVTKIIEDTSSSLKNPELEQLVTQNVDDALELFEKVQDSQINAE